MTHNYLDTKILRLKQFLQQQNALDYLQEDLDELAAYAQVGYLTRPVAEIEVDDKNHCAAPGIISKIEELEARVRSLEQKETFIDSQGRHWINNMHMIPRDTLVLTDYDRIGDL